MDVTVQSVNMQTVNASRFLDQTTVTFFKNLFIKRRNIFIYFKGFITLTN